MTNRPTVTSEHYLDAVAMVRATLHNDERGLLALINTMDNAAMTFQALVRLYIFTIGTMVDFDPEAADELLIMALAAFRTEQDTPPC